MWKSCFGSGVLRFLTVTPLLALVAVNNASADPVDLTAQLTGVKYASSGYTTVGVIFIGADLNQVIAGPEQWHQTSGTPLLGDINGNFLTFCVEITQDVHLSDPPTTYSFYTDTIDTAPTPGNPIPGGSGMGTAKAAFIQELWARHYADVIDAITGAAFQVAVWDIVYDADFNLNSGNLKAYGNTAVTNQATTWLNDVNTNSSPYTIPNLIALKSGTYQDQITVNPPVGAPPETPLPSTAAGAFLLFAGMGLNQFRRRRRCNPE